MAMCTKKSFERNQLKLTISTATVTQPNIHRYVQISMGIFQCFSYRTCNKSCMYALHVVTFARLIALLAFVTIVLTLKTLPICTIQNVKTEKWFCAKLFVISCNNNHFLSMLICCHPHAMAADIFGIHLLIYLNIYHLKVSTVAWDFPECFLYSLKLIWIPD